MVMVLPGAEVIVTVPLKLETPNKSNFEHWAVRARRNSRTRAVVWGVLHTKLRDYPLPCTVVITRIGPRSLDGDNLQGACKATRDGVADALFGTAGHGNDNEKCGITWVYAQERGKPKEYAVRLEIRAGAGVVG